MFVVKYRKFFYALSSILLIVSVVAAVKWGFNFSIDFKGGTIVEVDYAGTRPSPDVVAAQLALVSSKGLDATIRATDGQGANGYIIRMRTVTNDERTAIEHALGVLATSSQVMASSTTGLASSSAMKASVEEKQFDSIGPVLGAEASQKAALSIVFVILAIVIFISYAFRQVSQPVSSWKYGAVAIIALFHDVFIPTGAFIILGHYFGYEIDTLFVTALLVVLGFSVHDTIVVFDRVRENLRLASMKKPFEQIVGESISQTFTRSINTSLTTILALLVLYFVGGQATQHFTLALLIGIAAGTYSSIFIGSPLLVTIERMQAKKAAKKLGKK